MTVMHRIAGLLAAAALVAACTPATSPGPPTAQPAASLGCLPPTRTPDCHATPVPSPLGSARAAETRAAGEIAISKQTFDVPGGAHPHDVAAASDGGVWYTGQANGTLGWLDPRTGEVKETALGAGSAPHGVVSGPDGAAWVTDQGLQAIVRVTPGDFRVDVFRVPGETSPHTGAFDRDGILWFTGAAGFIGRLDPASGDVMTYPVPGGAGPYGITVTPSNAVWFVSLQRSYLGRVDKATGQVDVMEPPTRDAGTRRVWSDSGGRLWISYWNAGMLARFDPADGSWREWDLPGDGNHAYSTYVDELDAVWLSDFGTNSVVRFDPTIEGFQAFPSDRSNANVRQMLGRPGEAWGAESGLDRLVVFRYAPG